MSVGIIALGCAINIDRLKSFVKKISNKLRDVFAMTKSYIEWSQDRLVTSIVIGVSIISCFLIFVSVILLVNVL